MKTKPNLKYLIATLLLFAIVTPLGAIGHQWKFLVSGILYTAIGYLLVIEAHKYNHFELKPILFLIAPWLLIAPFYAFYFDKMTVSFPSTLVVFVGSFLGLLLARISRISALLIGSIYLGGIIWFSFVGYYEYIGL